MIGDATGDAALLRADIKVLDKSRLQGFEQDSAFPEQHEFNSNLKFVRLTEEGTKLRVKRFSMLQNSNYPNGQACTSVRVLERVGTKLIVRTQSRCANKVLDADGIDNHSDVTCMLSK